MQNKNTPGQFAYQLKQAGCNNIWNMIYFPKQLLSNSKQMKSFRNPSSDEKNFAMKYACYIDNNFRQALKEKPPTRNKSTKRLSKSKVNPMFMSSESAFRKLFEKDYGTLPKRQVRSKEINDRLKSPGFLKANIHFQNKNPCIPKSPKVGSLVKGHKKSITALEPQKTSQTLLKKGKIKAKLSADIKMQKIAKHRKAKSQDIDPQKLFDPDQFIKEDQDKSLANKFSATSRPGIHDNKPKINQDTYICAKHFFFDNSALFAVFDGHGTNGHFVSDFIRQILPQNIEYYALKYKTSHKNPQKEQVEQILRQSFRKTAIDLDHSKIDITFSGTTAVTTLLIDNNIYCANIGDSRAVICSFTKQHEWKVKPLSIDHCAEVQTEAQRIIKCKGRLEPYRDEDGEEVGPYRVWLADKQIPGLAMTRSFGDFVASTVGVISEPQIIHHKIEQTDRFMIIASDGLWQFISNQQAMQAIIPCFMRNDSEDAVKQLQNLALDSWMDEDKLIDDITIVVVFFPNY